MKIEIDRTGKNDPPWPNIIVDGQGCLVDISAIRGFLDDQGIVKVTWDDQIPVLFPAHRGDDGRQVQAEPAGRLWRVPPGAAVAASAAAFTDRSLLNPYLEAYLARLALLATSP